MFSSVSSIKGNTGIINIPVNIPLPESFLIALNLSDDKVTLGSIFLHNASSAVVIISFISTGECSDISFNISISLKTRSLRGYRNSESITILKL